MTNGLVKEIDEAETWMSDETRMARTDGGLRKKGEVEGEKQGTAVKKTETVTTKDGM
jgi:hypothetical protein